MKLPKLPKTNKPNLSEVSFLGINALGDEKSLYDAVNLIKNKKVETRRGRSPVIFYDRAPDQVIKCSDTVFHRYNNTLFEVINTAGGAEYGKEYALKNYDIPPKRHIVYWQNEFAVLPDAIILGEDDEWLDFGKKNTVAAAMPFLNSRAFYYPFGFNGEEVCSNHSVLTVGAKVRFNWLPGQEFTVISREDVREIIGTSTAQVGVRITLDKGVSNYTALTASSAMQYCIPKKRPIFKPFSCGLTCGLYFTGSEIVFKPYNDSKIYMRNIDNYLTVGQKVKITGCSESYNNRTAVITEINGNTITFDADFIPLDESNTRTITITPVLPEFDHLVFTEDRIFGACNKEGRLYVSKFKNPFVFTQSYTEKEDAWWLSLTENVTGITLWKDNIICFTETGGFRILGYNALNFGIRQLSLSGILPGLENSLVRLGDTLYYSSSCGVMKYSGGSDKKISSPLPQDVYITHAVTDGKNLYMLQDNRIWVYNPEEDFWFSEDATNITAIYTINQKRFLCGEKALYMADSKKFNAKWGFETNKIFSAGYDVKPLFAELTAKGGKGAEFEVFIKLFGKGQAISIGKYTIKGEKALRLPLKQVWCKYFSLKFVGSGEFSPYNLTICYRRKSL